MTQRLFPLVSSFIFILQLSGAGASPCRSTVLAITKDSLVSPRQKAETAASSLPDPELNTEASSFSGPELNTAASSLPTPELNTAASSLPDPELNTEASSFSGPELKQLLSALSPNKKQALQRFSVSECGADCLSLQSNSPISFRIKKTPELSSPEVTISPDSKILNLPSWDKLDMKLLKFWLVGHELHPQSFSSKSEAIQLTKAQQIAFEAVKEALRRGDSGFLHVSPTGTGKTLVLARALRENLVPGLHLVTAHQIHLVDQLHQAVQEELGGTEASVINWNERSNKTFVEEVEQFRFLKEPTALAITTQSLKGRLRFLEKERPELYTKLVENLRGIYIDEAHHLGAFQTKAALLKLKEESGAFLYGATATPVHQEHRLTELFETAHWSYLNGREDFFRSHSSKKVLEQLSLALREGEISPFDELYIIGRSGFKETKADPVFVKGGGNFYVLNPNHYNRLAGILYPLIQSNRKGFIVAASIEEAEDLTVFLNDFFEGVEFEVYHSKLSREERRGVLSRSRDREGFHYIVSVRALDEGVNLPHLSSYIDLNANVSVKRMAHRIGRVLRLHPGKTGSDILFLSNYRDAEQLGDLLELLDMSEMLSDFSGGVVKRVSGDAGLRRAEARVLSREELLELKRELETSAKSFWRGNKPPLEEAVEVLMRKNIRTLVEYRRQRKTDPELQELPSDLMKAYNVKWNEFKQRMGLEAPIRVREENRPSLEETLEVLVRKNILTEREYWRRRKTDSELQKLPSSLTQAFNMPWTEFKKRMDLPLRITKENQPPFEEALEILRKKGIQTAREYWRRRKTDPELQKLPSSLTRAYKKKWFEIKRRLGLEVGVTKENQPSFEEALEILWRKNIRTMEAYRRQRKTDPELKKLPSDLMRAYNTPWSEMKQKMEELEAPPQNTKEINL